MQTLYVVDKYMELERRSRILHSITPWRTAQGANGRAESLSLLSAISIKDLSRAVLAHHVAGTFLIMRNCKLIPGGVEDPLGFLQPCRKCKAGQC